MNNKIVFCNNCHSVSIANKTTRFETLLFLLLFLFPVGVLYSGYYLLVSEFKACGVCKSKDTLPYYSPKAKELMKAHGVGPEALLNNIAKEKRPWFRAWWVVLLACVFGFFFFAFFMVFVDENIGYY